MNIKSSYFKMSKDEFNHYLNELKNSSNTISFFDYKFYFYNNIDTFNLLLKLNEIVTKLDNLIHTFSSFCQKQIIQSFLIEEIEATNSIENIYSTKHDIFKIISVGQNSSNKKIISISNFYKYLLENGGLKIERNKDIRDIYDKLLFESIDKQDLPDGLYYRKNNVYITNGLDTIHLGIVGENNIEEKMNEFIKLYNSNMNTFLKLILSHFLFETIHPFYDGNGRMGRFLFSNKLYLEKKSYTTFLISLSFEKEKNNYYKAFKETTSKYEFGFLNVFVDNLLKILIKEFSNIYKRLYLQKETINTFTLNLNLTKSESKIYTLIYEATCFSFFGVSSKEILEETKVSKRTLIYTLNKFKKESLLSETKIGKFSYYKLK